MQNLFNFLAAGAQQPQRQVLTPVPSLAPASLEPLTLQDEQKKILTQTVLDQALTNDVLQRLSAGSRNYESLGKAVLNSLPDEAKQNFSQIKDDLKSQVKKETRPGNTGLFALNRQSTPFEQKLVIQQLQGRPRDFNRVIDRAAEEGSPELQFDTQSQYSNRQGQDTILNLLKRIGANLSPGVR